MIFDCDGVLVDTEPLHYRAFQEVLQPLGLGHDFDHYLKHYIGFDDKDAFLEAFRETGRPLEDSTLGRLMRAKEEALQDIISKGVSSFPGVIRLVHELAESGVPLAVASGALHHEVDTFTGGLGIKEAFAIVVAADDVKKSKPDPETYLLALEELQNKLKLNRLDPGRCIAIEDTPTGIQSAKGAGLFVIAVANSFPSEQLSEADHVLQSLADLSVDDMNRIIEVSCSSRKA